MRATSKRQIEGRTSIMPCRLYCAPRRGCKPELSSVEPEVVHELADLPIRVRRFQSLNSLMSSPAQNAADDQFSGRRSRFAHGSLLRFEGVTCLPARGSSPYSTKRYASS